MIASCLRGQSASSRPENPLGPAEVVPAVQRKFALDGPPEADYDLDTRGPGNFFPHGVDVKADSPDLRGKVSKATGLLEGWTDTNESIAAADAIAGPIQSRGPGTYYRLVDQETKAEAQVKPIK